MMRNRLAILAAAVAVVLTGATQYRIITQLNSLERKLHEIKSAPRPSPRTARPTPELPAQPLSIEGAALMGARNAPLAIVAYSDFQCPYCARFADTTFRDLEKQYISKGKVLFAFRHLPLTRIHPQAFSAAAAATCAAEQGKFWEMHDRLFAATRQLSDSSWPSFARELRLDVSRFQSCLVDSGPAVVQKDVELAHALQVTGTPTFLIGTIDSHGNVTVTERFSGSHPLSKFKTALDTLLARVATD
jgi:protein-disulfide isomerase